MPTLRTLLVLPGACAVLFPAAAQTFPSKPLEVVLPFAAGGPADVVARDVSQRLSAVLGQPVIVDNQGGAMGVNAVGTVARADATRALLISTVVPGFEVNCDARITVQ